MHLILLTRGILSQMEDWKALMRAQRFPWKRKNLKTGEEEQDVVQGALRPIQIWEYVFPEESLNDVLGNLQIEGPIERPEIKSISWALRKMLKLKQIPKMPEGGYKVSGYTPLGTINGKPMAPIPANNMYMQGVAVYPIGIKEDITKDYKFKLENGEEVEYNQEGL